VLDLSGVALAYAAGGDVLRDFSMHVGAGEFVVLVGPSGCGKSTVLKLIAGLLTPTAGRIYIDGRDVTLHPPQKRDVAMVFQSYALYPHMTVRENIAFPLRLRQDPDAQRKVDEVAASLGLSSLLDRKPKQLSGGQRQRVAMGRAIVRAPKAFLFDEPLSNLDASLRAEIRAEILRLHQRLGRATVYVTHDQHEAMTLADRVVLLKDGVIVQTGAPVDVYERPANRFAAAFIGQPSMQFVAAATLPFRCDADTVGIRPEHLSPSDDGVLAGTIRWIERTGREAFATVDGPGWSLTALLPPGEWQQGQALRLAIRRATLFDRAGAAVGSL
jgi:ABC-type sugar transport system ATPase subunit